MEEVFAGAKVSDNTVSGSIFDMGNSEILSQSFYKSFFRSSLILVFHSAVFKQDLYMHNIYSCQQQRWPVRKILNISL